MTELKEAGMRIYLGEEGLGCSCQEPFKATTKCQKCGKEAKIMFVGQEEFESAVRKDYICDLHETTGKKGGLWLHDVCAVAVYLCPLFSRNLQERRQKNYEYKME